jgi:hypothetical protein
VLVHVWRILGHAISTLMLDIEIEMNPTELLSSNSKTGIGSYQHAKAPPLSVTDHPVQTVAKSTGRCCAGVGKPLHDAGEKPHPT